MTWNKGRLDKAQAELEAITGWPKDYPERAQVRRVLHSLIGGGGKGMSIWHPKRLEEAQEELWDLAQQYFGGGAAPDEERIHRTFRLALHRLAYDAWAAHMLHTSILGMGIDEEVWGE